MAGIGYSRRRKTGLPDYKSLTGGRVNREEGIQYIAYSLFGSVVTVVVLSIYGGPTRVDRIYWHQPTILIPACPIFVYEGAIRLISLPSPLKSLLRLERCRLLCPAHFPPSRARPHIASTSGDDAAFTPVQHRAWKWALLVQSDFQSVKQHQTVVSLFSWTSG